MIFERKIKTREREGGRGQQRGSAFYTMMEYEREKERERERERRKGRYVDVQRKRYIDGDEVEGNRERWTADCASSSIFFASVSLICGFHSFCTLQSLSLPFIPRLSCNPLYFVFVLPRFLLHPSRHRHIIYCFMSLYSLPSLVLLLTVLSPYPDP